MFFSLSFSVAIITWFAASLSLSCYCCCAFCFSLTKLCFRTDIDQLTRILLLCGTPDSEFLHKITSDEVSAKYKTSQTYFFTSFLFLLQILGKFFSASVTPLSLDDHHVFVQARNYIRSLPKMEKKNLHEVFKGANPLGKK